MNADYDCPVCGGRKWLVLDRLTISANQPATNAYADLRRRVLFELWSPATAAITLAIFCCSACGFVSYTPRPTSKDVHEKYSFLQRYEKNIGGQANGHNARASDERRARRIFEAVSQYTGKRKCSVLDFGGGNGKLLAPFISAGHSCDLIDYSVCPLPGVNKIADTLDDDVHRRTYDVIICSHVLEHLAEPGRIASQLRERLSGEGVIYCEVPSDLREGFTARLKEDPVTHINFFNRESFRALLEQNALAVLECKTAVGTYNGHRLDVISAIAGRGRRMEMKDRDPEIAVSLTRRLLNPTLVSKVARRWRLRQFPTLAGIARRVRRIQRSLPTPA